MKRYTKICLAIFLLLILNGSIIFSQTYILNEDFSSASGTTPPPGWTNITQIGQPYDKWHFANPGNRMLNYPVSGQFAIFDSENYSFSGGAEDVVLQSSILDCSIGTNILLIFDHYFVSGNGGQAKVEVFNGSSWLTVATYNSTSLNPQHVTINVSAQLGGISNAKLRFRWLGNGSQYWAIDNVKVLSPLALDAGITIFNGPQMPFSGGQYNVLVSLGNFGFSNLTSTTLAWTVNGIAQTPAAWTGNLAYGQFFSNISMGSVSFPSGLPTTIKVWPTIPNGGNDLNAWNDTLVKTFYSCLEGIYTIGGINPSYMSFGQAADALELAGQCEAVTFKVRNGEYHERFALGNIMGNSALNTITYESESGDSSLVTINYQMSDPYQDYSILIDGADYVTIRDMSVFRANGDYCMVIQGNSHHINIENNRLQHVHSPNSSCDSALTFSMNHFNGCNIRLFQQSNTTNQHISISNNVNIGGIESNTLNGMTISNNQIVWLNFQFLKNVDIIGNTIYHNGTAGYFNGCDNVLIQDNDIDFSCWYWGTNGLQIENGGHFMILNNSIDRICAWGWGDGWAIYTYNNDFVKIQDNDLYNWHGIHIHTNDTSIIEGNYIDNPYNWGHGIYLATSLDSVLISQNLITGYENGIYGDVGANGDNWITDNEIWNIRYRGIYLSGDGSHVHDNIIKNIYEGNGIYCTGNQHEILRNVIDTCITGNGITCSGSTNSVAFNRIRNIKYGDGIFFNGNNNQAWNNFIQVGGEGTANGLHLGQATVSNQIYFNNFKVNSNDIENGNSLLVEGGSGITLGNNIFSNQGGGHAAKFNSVPSNSSFHHNDYFAQGFKFISASGTDLSSITDWHLFSGLDSLSLNENPFFSNDTLLSPNQVLLNGSAQSIASIYNDINFVTRTSSPDIGAIEFNPCALDAGVNHILGLSNPLPVGSTSIYAVLQNQGTTSLSIVNLNWSINGATMGTIPWTGSLAYQASDTVLLGSFTFGSGTSYNVSAWTTNPNGLSDCNDHNDLSFLDHLITPLCGTYTIGGSNPDFPNFTEAANALNQAGISCPVTFLVRTGSYNERVKLNEISGSSAINTITFQSEANDSMAVELKYQVYNPTNDYSLLLDGTDFITFRKLGIFRSNGNRSVIIQGGSHHVTLEYNRLGHIISPSSSCDSLLFIQSNDISNSKIEIYQTQQADTAKGIWISDNVNILYIGVNFSKDIHIQNNQIWKHSNAAIDVNNCRHGLIDENDIVVDDCYDGIGIQLNSCFQQILSSNHIQILSGCWNSYTRYGIILNSGGQINVSNNEIDITNFDYNGFGIYCVSASDTIWVENNNIYNSRQGIYADNPSVTVFKNNQLHHMQNNGIEVNGGKSFYVGNWFWDIPNFAIKSNTANSQIIGNRFWDMFESKCILINSSNNLIFNNFIQSGGFGISEGIRIEPTADSTRVLFNSILITSTDENQGRGIHIKNTNGLEIKNNCIANNGGGYCLYLNDSATGCVFNNNNYYSQYNKLAWYNANGYGSIPSWQAATGTDTQTLSVIPFYSNDTSLVVNQSLLQNKAVPSGFVGIDIDSLSRDPQYPDIGAKEWSLCPNDAGINAITGVQNPMVTGVQSIFVTLQNHGTNPLTSAQINWSVNGVLQPVYNWSGNLAVGANLSFYTGSYSFLSGTVYQIKAWTQLPNGFTDCNHHNDTLSLNDLFTPLCGIFTIGGTNPDFETFSQAAHALNVSGVNCPVVFKVRNGVYNEHIILHEIPGSSAINTITFESENLDSSLVNLFFTDYSPSNDYTVKLDGCDFVKFKKMGITRSNGDTSVVLQNNSHHITFESNILGNVYSPPISCDSVLTFSKNWMEWNWIKLLQPANISSKLIKVEDSRLQRIELDNTKSITIKDNYFHYDDSNWDEKIVINLLGCQNIGIYGNYIHQWYYAANARGIKIDNCQNSMISGNTILTSSYYNNSSIYSINCSNLKIELNDLMPQSMWDGQRMGLNDLNSDSILSRSNQYNCGNRNYDGYGLYLDGTGTFVKIINDSIVNCRNGIYMNSSSPVNQILENKFHNNKDNSILVTAISTPALIDKNKITWQYYGNGINLQSMGNIVTHNRFENLYESRGIVVNGPNTLVYNNFINCGGYGLATGIVADTGSTNSSIIFNSMNITSTHVTLGRAFEMLGGTGLKVKNNIFSNPGGGYAAWISPSTSGYNWDYNNYYTSGSVLARYQGQNKINLLAFQQATGNDPNAKDLNPYFQNVTELRPWQREINGAGIPFTGILLDIDGEIRNANAPDIGADEFTVDFGVIELLSPTLNCNLGANDSVRVLVKQYGDIPFIGLQLAYQVNNGIIHQEFIPGAINNDIEYTFSTTENLSASGTYHFKVWIVNANDDNINNDTLHVDRYKSVSPHINLGWQTQCAGIEVPFWASGSIAGGTISQYVWDFGDGNSAAGANVVHNYGLSGSYNVTLWVYSAVGCYSDTVFSVLLMPTPVAQFSVNNVCDGQAAVFQNQTTVSGGLAVNQSWTFGDGAYSSSSSPTHLYAQAGTYNVELIAFTTEGCADTIMQQLVVYPSPNAQIIGLNSVQCSNSPDVVLSGSPTGGVFAGDGVLYNIFKPSIIQPGSYPVTYTCGNQFGCISSDSVMVTIFQEPTVSFSSMGPTICENANPLVLVGSPTGGTFTGGGVVGNTFNPANLPLGLHTILYYYSDVNGCANDAMDNTVIISSPIAGLTGVSAHYCIDDSSVILSGSPTGGIYFGDGVSGNQFSPSSATAGIHLVNYLYTETTGCTDTAILTTTVHGLPVLNITNPGASLCTNSGIINLTAVPSGGAFTGPTVSGNNFYPGQLSTGSYSIGYSYTDSWGCFNSISESTFIYNYPLPNLGNDFFIPQSVSIPVSPGSFSVYHWSNNSSQPVLNISSPGNFSVTVTDVNGCQNSDTVSVLASPWIYSQTNLSHQIVIPSGIAVSIDGTQAQFGDLVGVFFDSLGVLKNAGCILWNNQADTLMVFGDIPLTPAIEGFSTGEVFKWRIFDFSSGAFYSAIPTYSTTFPNTNQFAAGGLSGLVSLVAFTEYVQEIPLPLGWSIFSTYISPIGPSMISMFSSIVQNVVIVKSGSGLIYWPQYNLNTIGNLTQTAGYQVKTSQSCILSVTGSPVIPDITAIPLPNGWSIVSYLRMVPGNAVVMFQPVVNQITIVKSGSGSIYWPLYNLNTIGNLLPGQGYQVKMQSSTSFYYPSNPGAISKSILFEPQLFHFEEAKNTGHNMTLGIQFEIQDYELRMLEIGVFNLEGMLVGSSVVEGEFTAITLWGDDELTIEKDGLLPGDEFVVKVWNSSSDEVSQLNIETWIEGDGFYQKDKISVAGKNKGVLAVGTKLYQNQPNPFTHETEFSFYLPEKTQVEFTVLNLLGEKVETLINEEMDAGKHSLNYQTKNLPAGSYYYKLETSNFNDTRRMMIIK